MFAIMRRLRGKQNADSAQAIAAEAAPAPAPCSPPARSSPPRSRSRSPPGAPGKCPGARAFSPRRSVGANDAEHAGSPRRNLGAKRDPSPRRSIGNAAAPLRRSTGNRSRCSGGGNLRRRSRAAARSRKSFAHQEFANPYAETCWLSCLFQSLWHSVVFHKTFEEELVPSKYVATPEERLLAALQRTWVEYHAVAAAAAATVAVQPTSSSADTPPVEESKGTPAQEAAKAPGDCTQRPVPLVPSEALADGFGEGYGDMSEALACLQQELEASCSPAAARIASLLALLPVAIASEGEDDDDEDDESVWPTPARAWRQAEEWGLAAHAIIAVDIAVPFELAPDECHRLAELWTADGGELVRDSSSADAGHRLVALVCFMWGYRHYVAFCRRQSEPSRCVFFNDLPMLATGSPKELAWSDVPGLCRSHQLAPRLALYESRAHVNALVSSAPES